MQSLKGESASGHEMPVGRAALIASIGGERGWADWANPDHRLRRLLAEFIGMAGLTFVLSGGAAILARYGGHGLQPWQIVLVLSAVSALWLVVAVYFLGDISAHFNPATTLAFALRRDMGWVMAGAYWVVQFGAAVCGSLLGRAFFGPAGHLAATMPKPGQAWQAAAFEAVITFGLVLMILNMANGPKLNGPFVPLAVGAYIMAWGTMGGPYEGASMNPARSFGPDVAIGNLSTWWVYLVGPAAGAVMAVGVAHVLRGPAKAQEASAAVGTPLDHSACILRAEDECPRPRSSRKTRAQSGKRFLGPRVPPSLFGIVLGIAGLAQAWRAAAPLLGTPQAVPDALSILDAAMWLVLVGLYLAQGPRIIMADLRDPVLSPFVSASVITAMLLSATLANDAFTAGRVLVIVFLAVTVALGGWLTGQWMTGGIEPDSVHPGYFLPTAAGGLIGANAAAQVHLHALAEASFGIGIISWILLASTLLNRLSSRPALPSALVPTMAIEFGITAVAGSAYFAVAGRGVSLMACVLGGYAVLMALAQLRLIPVYRRVSFTPGAWSFAFSYAAAAGYALEWLAIKKPPAATGYAIAVFALLTAFVAWIAFRTVVLAVRGQLFPAWPPVHQAADAASPS